MAKFTKLNIGDAVASSGGRVWKKLSAENAEVQDELAGTWVFNEVPVGTSSGSYVVKEIEMNFSSNGNTFDSFQFYQTTNSTVSWVHYFSGDVRTTAYEKNSGWYSSYRTIYITSKLSEVNNGSTWLDWLKANATKQTTVEPEEPEEPEESLAGTWVINSQFTATSGYGIFNVNCSDSGDPDLVATQFGIGYSFSFDDGFTASTDRLAMGTPVGATYVSRISSDYVVTFIDGDDINNSLLLTWLKANAIKQVDTNEDGGSAE